MSAAITAEALKKRLEGEGVLLQVEDAASPGGSDVLVNRLLMGMRTSVPTSNLCPDATPLSPLRLSCPSHLAGILLFWRRWSRWQMSHPAQKKEHWGKKALEKWKTRVRMSEKNSCLMSGSAKHHQLLQFDIKSPFCRRFAFSHIFQPPLKLFFLHCTSGFIISCFDLDSLTVEKCNKNSRTDMDVGDERRRKSIEVRINRFKENFGFHFQINSHLSYFCRWGQSIKNK